MTAAGQNGGVDLQAIDSPQIYQISMGSPTNLWFDGAEQEEAKLDVEGLIERALAGVHRTTLG